VNRIISATNPRIKALAGLKERKARERQGRFLIEGAREVERAIAAGIELELALVSDSLNPEEQHLHAILNQVECEILKLSEGPLRKLSLRENPARIIAVAKLPQRSLRDLKLPRNPLLLVAAGLEKPGNLGAILRSADAAGAHAVLIAGGVDLWSPQVIRNSTGVIFSLFTVAASERLALEWIVQHQIPMVATTPHADQLYWQADLRGQVAITVGPEHTGLSEEWLQAAQQRVCIPMEGQADSLNVSVSAALLLYEALRQRTVK